MIRIDKLDRIKTFGNSMYPLLHNNDVVYFKKTAYKDIQINDLLVVKHDNTYVTHRVIYKTDSYVITKGDNNLTIDHPVNKHNIVGRLGAIKRNNQLINPENIYLIQSTYYYKEIVKLLTILDNKNINNVVLKGLPLHLYYDGQYPRRLYIDCDLLVKQENFKALDTLLSKNGYESMNTHIRGLEKSDNSQKTYKTYLSKFPVLFDIHLFPSFTIVHIETNDIFYPKDRIFKMLQEFIRNKRLITVQEHLFPILSVPHLVVYLSLHLFHHNYRGIFRLDLIHKIIRKEVVDEKAWSDIAVFIQKYELNDMVYPVFLMLNRYYGSVVYESFLKKITPTRFTSRYIANKVIKDIFNDENRISAGVNRFILLFFLSPNPWVTKLKILLNPEIITMAVWVIFSSTKSILKKYYFFLFAVLKNRVKKISQRLRFYR